MRHPLSYWNATTSLCRQLFAKLCFRDRLILHTPIKVYIGPFCTIDLTRGNGRIEAEGKLVLRRNVFLKSSGGEIRLGANCFLNNGVSITSYSAVEIGANALLGDNVRIYDHDHIFGPNVIATNEGLVSAPVKIGENVWIGSGSTVLRGVTIGDNCVIAAGTIVRGNIPPNSLVRSSCELVVTTINRSNLGKGDFVEKTW